MSFELELVKLLQSFRSEFSDFLFQVFTMFGEELVIIGILGFFYWVYNKKIGEIMGISVFVSLALNSTIKTLFQRLRPYQVDSSIVNIRPETSGGYSFPSGHTQGAATVFSAVGFFLKKRWISITVGIIILLVAISRLYIGVHYLSDVVVGAMLGIGISWVFAKYLTKKEDNQRIYRVILFVAGFILLIITLLHRFVFEIQVLPNSTNAFIFLDRLEDGYKMVGAMLGFVLGLAYEKKHVQFEQHKRVIPNLVRFALGVVVVMAIRLSLSFLFDFIISSEDLGHGEFLLAFLALMFDFIRYGFMVFVAIGLYPKLFKVMKV